MLSTFLLPVLALSAVSATPLAAPSIATRSTKPVVGAWYAGWRAEDGFPLSYVSWEKYTTLYYSFAEPTQNISTLSLAGSDGEMLPQFVTTAHANDVEAHIAVGGWTGSVWFSSHLSTAENRTAFVQTVADFALQYNLDGVQFDWEYPNHQGIGCNTVSVNDTANFLAFLQELRANPVAERLTLSAAVSLAPFNDATGSPSADVSGFAKVLDYVSVMNYDVWGSWSSTVGPNAPLNDTCAAPANQQGSAVSAVKAWTDAGMPANQIVLGVAAYGHSFSVSPSNAFMPDAPETLVGYPAFNASNQPLGDAWDDTGSVDICGNAEGPGGTFNFWGLIDDGFLTETGAPAGGIFYRYDNCSQTSYVYNETSQVLVSFDNIPSFAAKGEYIKDAGLRGFSMWQAGGDHNDLLLDSIIDAFGCN